MHKGNFRRISSVQFSRSVVSDSLGPHELQHARPPCPSPTPGVHSDSRPSSWWCHSAISSSVAIWKLNSNRPHCLRANTRVRHWFHTSYLSLTSCRNWVCYWILLCLSFFTYETHVHGNHSTPIGCMKGKTVTITMIMKEKKNNEDHVQVKKLTGTNQ